MTDAEFIEIVRELLESRDATDIDVFTEKPYGDRDRLMGAACMFRGARYELSMMHGRCDDLSKRNIIVAAGRLGVTP